MEMIDTEVITVVTAAGREETTTEKGQTEAPGGLAMFYISNWPSDCIPY